MLKVWCKSLPSLTAKCADWGAITPFSVFHRNANETLCSHTLSCATLRQTIGSSMAGCFNWMHCRLSKYWLVISPQYLDASSYDNFFKKKNLNKYLLYIMLSITQFHVDLWCSVTVSRGDSLTAQMSAKAEYEQESMIYLNATFQYFFVKYVKLEVFRVIRLVYCRKRRSLWGLGSLHAGKYHTGICILPWGRWCCNGSLRSATSLRRDRVPEASSVTDPYSLGPVYVCVYLIHAVITVKKVISYPETKVNFSYRVMKSKSQ